MINKKIMYKMKHCKIKHYQPYKKSIKIIDVMKQSDKILNSYYPNSNLTDAQGSSKAYGNGKGYYIDGDKMYVAGTFGKGTFGGAVNDILADVGLPLKTSKYSQRYRDTSTALDENNDVKHLITHSLGSSVGAQITKDYPQRELTLTTYSAPFISRRSKIPDDYISFRSILGPVSILDRSAVTVYTGYLLVLKLHCYKFHQQNLLLHIVLFVRLPRCFHMTVMLVLLHQTYQGTIRVEELVYQFEP